MAGDPRGGQRAMLFTPADVHLRQQKPLCVCEWVSLDQTGTQPRAVTNHSHTIFFSLIENFIEIVVTSYVV